MSEYAEGNHLNLIEFLACGAHLYSFRLPTTKSIDFHEHFKGYLENADNLSFIHKLQHSRMSMCAELSSDTSSESKLRALDEYIPNIYYLLDSLMNQPPVEISKQFSFEWRGSITISNFPSIYQEIIYEVAMVLHSKVRRSVNAQAWVIEQPTSDHFRLH